MVSKFKLVAATSVALFVSQMSPVFAQQTTSPLSAIPLEVSPAKPAPSTAPAKIDQGAKPSTPTASVILEPAPFIQPPTMAQALPTGRNTLYRQLDELRSQNALLAESVKAADMRAQLAKTAGTVSAVGVPGGVVTPVSGPQTAQVQMVSGSEGQYRALISLPGGGAVNVRVGHTIPGLGLVKSIAISEVIVAGKNQTISIPFANEGAGAFTAGVR